MNRIRENRMAYERDLFAMRYTFTMVQRLTHRWRILKYVRTELRCAGPMASSRAHNEL
jgi:hypothetical protein